MLRYPRPGLLADERGSVIAMTDGTGTVTQVNKYDVDGLPDPENIGRFQFTGQMWIPEASVYHFKARAYHPGLGRFMQTDPSGLLGGLNLYAYAEDDPVNFSDTTGLCEVTTATGTSDDGQNCPGLKVPGDRCWPAAPLEPLESNLSGDCYFKALFNWLGEYDRAGPAPQQGGSGPGSAPGTPEKNEPFSPYLCAKTGTHCMEPPSPARQVCASGQAPNVFNNPSLGANVKTGALLGVTVIVGAVVLVVGFPETDAAGAAALAEGGAATEGSAAAMERFLLSATEVSHPAVSGAYSTGVGLTTGVMGGVAVTMPMCPGKKP